MQGSGAPSRLQGLGSPTSHLAFLFASPWLQLLPLHCPMRAGVSRPRVRPALIVSALAVCVEGQAGPRLCRASPLPGLPEVPGRAYLSWAEVGPGRPAWMEGGGCFPERAFRQLWAPGGRAEPEQLAGPSARGKGAGGLLPGAVGREAPFAGGLFCVGDSESGTVVRQRPRACRWMCPGASSPAVV